MFSFLFAPSLLLLKYYLGNNVFQVCVYPWINIYLLRRLMTRLCNGLRSITMRVPLENRQLNSIVLSGCQDYVKTIRAGDGIH